MRHRLYTLLAWPAPVLLIVLVLGPLLFMVALVVGFVISA
jgi:hypothetical protein